VIIPPAAWSVRLGRGGIDIPDPLYADEKGEGAQMEQQHLRLGLVLGERRCMRRHCWWLLSARYHSKSWRRLEVRLSRRLQAVSRRVALELSTDGWVEEAEGRWWRFQMSMAPTWGIEG